MSAGQRGQGAVVADDWDSEMGIVRSGRWLAWGYQHGRTIRPHWLARLIVHAWNVVSCHLDGHEIVPEVSWPEGSDEPTFSETRWFCPHCCAEGEVPQ